MILLPAIFAGIVIALLRGGDLRRLAVLPVHLGWLAVVCLIAQLYVIYSPVDKLEAERSVHATLLIGSSVALLLVVWANRRLPAMAIIGIGLFLNLVVMAANGGFMPVSREATMAAGTRSVQDAYQEGDRLPRSKDVLLSQAETRFWILSDVIVAPQPLARVYSFGDIVVGAGVFVLLQAATVTRKNRLTEEISDPAIA
ncbi:MAG TPA: DUF5317 domain-containing protein [Chloroflexota bacterium]